MSDNTTRRAFYCQDSLWQSFSDLAAKRGCAVDTLINEAMTSYLQSFPASGPQNHNYSRQPYPSGQAVPSRAPAPQPVAAAPAYNRQPAPINAAAPINAPAPGYRNSSSIPPAPIAPPGNRIPPAPPGQNYRRPPSIFEEPVSEGPSPGGKPMVLASLSQPAQPVAPYQPQPGYPQAAPAQGQPPLYIIFANQRYAVEKDKYIIGRSSQLADLVIRDGNISRKHCAVIFKNGAYYIKDLDSTNGIEFQGHRIDTKRIEEGDQFNICEFHFTFTYR